MSSLCCGSGVYNVAKARDGMRTTLRLKRSSQPGLK